MQLHHVVAICVVIAMAFVIDSTVKLFRFRRKNKIVQAPWQMRDLRVLRRPNDFPVEEARLTYRNWLACAAMLALLGLFLAVNPANVVSGAADGG